MKTVTRIGAFSILSIVIGVCMSACIAQGEPAAESPDEASVGEAKEESTTTCVPNVGKPCGVLACFPQCHSTLQQRINCAGVCFPQNCAEGCP